MDSLDILLEHKIHCFKVISKAQIGDRLCTSHTNTVTIDHGTDWLPWYIPDMFQAFRRGATGDSRQRTITVLNNLVNETSILTEAMLTTLDTQEEQNLPKKVYSQYTNKLDILSKSLIQSINGLKNICEHQQYKTDANFITDIEIVIDYLGYLSKKINDTIKI